MDEGDLPRVRIIDRYDRRHGGSPDGCKDCLGVAVLIFVVPPVVLVVAILLGIK